MRRTTMPGCAIAAGQPFAATARFMHVRVRHDDGRWRIVASQMTNQPPPGLP